MVYCIGMKKLILTILLLFLTPSVVNAATNQSLVQRLLGRILLQVESYGRAWYVDPTDGLRYYLQDGAAAYELMRTLSLGISDKDLTKIPAKKGDKADRALVNRLRGRILLQVEQHGEAWYLNPTDGLRYYLADGPTAYGLMRTLSLGITDDNLRQIPMNDTQVVADTTFNDVAAVAWDGDAFFGERHADQILPLASMSKLVTALVLLDRSPVWDAPVVITADHIRYPRDYVGDDATSEVELKAGDRIDFGELWTAMLCASSNQAAVALADSTGLSRAEFVALMNAKARELGLTHTVFYDIAGLDAHNVSTPREFAKIAQLAFDQPKIAQASVTTEAVAMASAVDGTERPVKIVNRNYSLLKFGVDGAKTGYLVEAHLNVALRKGDTIIVIMHARTKAERNQLLTELLAP